MNWFFELSPELRLGIVAFAGVLIGTQVNRGIYRLAYHRHSVGPWSPRAAQAPPRSWFDYLPIAGWFSLRREASLHGRGFWVRPMLIELLLGVGLATLYWWEVEQQALRPATIGGWPTATVNLPKQDVARVHAQFLAHAILIVLMTIASFIDIDEKMIPPAITDLGAIGGLILMTLLPISRLPEWEPFAGGALTEWNNDTLLQFASPHPPPTWLRGAPGLGLALACFTGWWLAITPIVWTPRGFALARRLVRRSLRQGDWFSPLHYPLMLIGGWLLVSGAWLLQGTLATGSWVACVSSLVGMVAGGAIVWAVRIIGSHALKQEAMGFGDVTLVAMIGAFLGWQPCLMLFFIAPFIGVVIAVTYYIIMRDQAIWFGPFLCAGGLLTIIYWATLWEEYGRNLFGFAGGKFVPSVVVILFAMMWAMLVIWRFIKERLLFREQ